MFGIQRAPTHPISRHPTISCAIRGAAQRSSRPDAIVRGFVSGGSSRSRARCSHHLHRRQRRIPAPAQAPRATCATSSPRPTRPPATTGSTSRSPGRSRLNSVLPDLGGTGELIVEGPGAAKPVARSGAARWLSHLHRRLGADVKIVGLTIAGFGHRSRRRHRQRWHADRLRLHRRQQLGQRRLSLRHGRRQRRHACRLELHHRQQLGRRRCLGRAAASSTAGRCPYPIPPSPATRSPGQFSGSGGGIYNTGLLTVTDSILANNSATGGGIASDRGSATFWVPPSPIIRPLTAAAEFLMITRCTTMVR